MTLALELGGIHDPAVRRALEQLSQQFPVPVTGGGGGGAPSGPAGGDLTGTYPNPGIAPLVIVDGDISASAAIAKSKLAALNIVNADVDAAAAIARSKLDFGSGLVNADIAAAAAIAKTKLASLDVVNADVNAAAAIAESKLSLATDAAAGTGSRRTIGTGALQAAAGNDARFTDSRAPNGAAGGDLSGTYPNPQIAAGTIVDADINAAAAVAESKLNLATDAAAGTGSRRTLGTSATSAAAGNRGMPTGGATGTVLTKNSATDYDASFLAAGGGGAPSGPAGGDLAGTYPNPALAARAYWRLRLTANTSSIANAGTLAIAWTQEDSDTFGLHAASATTVVIGRAGTYLVGTQIYTGAPGFTVEIQTNAAASALDPGDLGGTAANGVVFYKAMGLLNLAAADTVRVFVTNNSGGAQVVVGNTTSYQAAKFWGYWMGP